MPDSVLGAGCMSSLIAMRQETRAAGSLGASTGASPVPKRCRRWQSTEAESRGGPRDFKNLREEVALKRSVSPSAKRPLKGHRSQGASLASQTANGEPRVEHVPEHSVVSDSL